MVADAADGADGIVAKSTHPDDSVSGSAFTTERNVDAQGPQERLRAARQLRALMRQSRMLIQDIE